MTETRLAELQGSELRYSGDDWELTGKVTVKRNGEALDVEGRKTERVRGNTAIFRFNLQNPPASLNPGNLGNLSGHLEREDGTVFLVVERDHAIGRYRLDSMNYA